MPLYDFTCPVCQHRFEELSFAGDPAPACPRCGHTETHRELSAPSPLKTGAFPFKIGPVHPLAKNLAGRNRLNTTPPCHGHCASCGSSDNAGTGK